MNIFLSAGTLTILLAQSWLVWTVWSVGDTSHISGKSQMLYLLIFVSRYLNLFTTFISFYNAGLKIAYLVQSVCLVVGIYYNVKKRKTLEADSFKIYVLLVPTAILSLLLNYELSFQEIVWTFSIYLESVAMVPQMWLIRNTGRLSLIIFFLLASEF